jgi:hypothetical protein
MTGKEPEHRKGLGPHEDKKAEQRFWASEKPTEEDEFSFGDIAEDVGGILAAETQPVVKIKDPEAVEKMDLPVSMSEYISLMATFNGRFFNLTKSVDSSVKSKDFKSASSDIQNLKDFIGQEENRALLGRDVSVVFKFLLNTLDKRIKAMEDASNDEEFRQASESFNLYFVNFFKSFSEILEYFPNSIPSDPYPLEMQTLKAVYTSLKLPERPLSGDYEKRLKSRFDDLYTKIRQKAKQAHETKVFCDLYEGIDSDVKRTSYLDDNFWNNEVNEEELFKFECQHEIMQALVAGKITFEDLLKLQN